MKSAEDLIANVLGKGKSANFERENQITCQITEKGTKRQINRNPLAELEVRCQMGTKALTTSSRQVPQL